MTRIQMGTIPAIRVQATLSIVRERQSVLGLALVI